MIVRSQPWLPFSSILKPFFLPNPHTAPCLRHLHAQATASHPQLIPQPTPFVPDALTFLKLIGRNLSQHAAKIPTWTSLFSLTSTQLRDLGVEPARTRRYLLWWRDRFRKGIFGVGGDLKNVTKDDETVFELRIVEVPIDEAAGPNSSVNGNMPIGQQRTKRVVVNEPVEVIAKKGSALRLLEPVQGMKVVGVRTIAGPHVQAVKGTSGSVATIKVREGMWEVKRGVKVDGGERRKVQVRRKRLLEERKTSRK